MVAIVVVRVWQWLKLQMDVSDVRGEVIGGFADQLGKVWMLPQEAAHARFRKALDLYRGHVVGTDFLNLDTRPPRSRFGCSKYTSVADRVAAETFRFLRAVVSSPMPGASAWWER
jgi:hypothetical protein